MNDRLDEVLVGIVDDKPTPSQRRRMDILDILFVELQNHVEKKCRKILKPDMVFSRPIKLWYESVQAYKVLFFWEKATAATQLISCIQH